MKNWNNSNLLLLPRLAVMVSREFYLDVPRGSRPQLSRIAARWTSSRNCLVVVVLSRRMHSETSGWSTTVSLDSSKSAILQELDPALFECLQPYPRQYIPAGLCIYCLCRAPLCCLLTQRQFLKLGLSRMIFSVQCGGHPKLGAQEGVHDLR